MKNLWLSYQILGQEEMRDLFLYLCFQDLILKDGSQHKMILFKLQNSRKQISSYNICVQLHYIVSSS